MSFVKTKKRVGVIGIVVAAALVVVMLAPAAQADSLVLTRIGGSYSGSGGEFNLTPTSGPAMDYVGGTPALNGNSFQSFCLEENEFVTSASAPYDYVINTGAVLGGNGGQTSPGFDPLDARTAWLYASFIGGSLTGYDYNVGSGRNASAGALQNAIWYSEDEITSLPGGLATQFYNAAVAAAPTSIGNVRVLNLYYREGYRQDQLIMLNSVPVPSAILIGLPLLGMIGAFRLVRRRR